MVRWSRFVIRNRKKVLAAWLLVFLAATVASSGLGDLLENRFRIPDSDAQRGSDLLSDRLNERGEGAFTLVVRSTDGSARDSAFVARAHAAARRAAGAVPGAKAGAVQQAGKGIAYIQIPTPLHNDAAGNKTPAIREAIDNVPGARTYLSGWPAVEHDTDPIYSEDTLRGEMIAIPIALLVMLFMFGTLAGISVPLAFAFLTIQTTLGIVWIFAHYMAMSQYVTQIVTLIGLGIAIDYSMLVVFRYREELERTEDAHLALERTMATAGRATFFSGLTVAIGLALLVLMPVPFMRSMGLGGLLIPLVSISASATFLPALLAVMGRGINRFRLVPKRILQRRAGAEGGLWTRLARTIMRRPVAFLVGSSALLIALIIPALGISLTGGDNRGQPTNTEATQGIVLLERTLGPGALSPHQIAIDTASRNGVWTAQQLRAQRRLLARLRRDPEVRPTTAQAPALLVRQSGVPDAATLRRAQQASLVDRSGRVAQLRIAGEHDYGTPQATDLVNRLRDTYVPQAGFGGATVYVTGAAAYDVDFIDKSYGAFPWLVLAVLLLSYLVLLRAFRSLLLPAKAVLMNLLSVGATYGVLVLVFQHGWGGPLGFGTSPQIEAWIPIFLFAMLFGLSMDYEVFLLSRMREEWDATHDNEWAVAHGLERTGRIITAAAIIMIAAFSGFMTGSFVSLQEFGVGLSAAILLDATIVRMLLVPATMKLLGKWNWYLPERIRRLRIMGVSSRRGPIIEAGGD